MLRICWCIVVFKLFLFNIMNNKYHYVGSLFTKTKKNGDTFQGGYLQLDPKYISDAKRKEICRALYEGKMVELYANEIASTKENAKYKTFNKVSLGAIK